MSESVEVQAPTRRRGVRPQREVHREDAPGVTVERSEAVSPNMDLGDVAAQMRAKDQEVAQARQAAAEAEQRRVAAETAARQSQQTDRKAMLGEAITAAKADGEAAAAAYRAARESGDIEAEINAQRRLGAAEARFNQATSELATLNAAPGPEVTPAPQPSAPSMTPEAQRWVNEHPRMQDDAEYRNYAVAMDRLATLAGHRSGSQSYVDYIENEMKTRFGDNHAQEGSRGRPMANNVSRETNHGDISAPSQPRSGPRGGARTVRYPIGDMSVRKSADGAITINYVASYGKSESEIERDYEEAARITNPKLFERDKARAIGEYLQEAIAAADEGMVDLKQGDGRTWGSGRIDE